MAEKLMRHRSCRLQGLPLDSPLAVEGEEGLNMEQPTSIDDLVRTTSDIETRDDFTIYTNPLVQFPPVANVFVHSPMEGSVDGPNEAKFGPNAPFLRNSMGQSIIEFRVIRPSYRNPPLGEDEYRRIHASLN